ncbi:hypothetical protein [Oceanobacillus iheyensis HTE831]|uniref:Pre-toxin TG domain-containing protein n=1 Tax=Oceanobacillus iheyensis (strain DSM 14371 / CIP 107618 / JCM 11309 / KCTC 3954 / HTE831) TaxID=221109 RepID=Q8EL65_OCEIH|nr:hypothetical protein [Oceanobacillus iheyensis HTE831]
MVETTVNTGKTMWDGAVNFGKASFDVAAWAGEKLYGGGKAAVDFLFLDDMKTLVDNKATVGEKAMAGFFLLPIGKFGKAGKLVKEYDGFKVNSKGEVPAKKSKSNGDAKKTSSETSWSLNKEGATINGRKYSGHALERMAPKTPEVKAKLSTRAHKVAREKGLLPGSRQYSDFVQKYVQPRNVPPTVIEDVIKNGNRIQGNKSGTWVYDTKKLRVVLNDIGDVITVIPK